MADLRVERWYGDPQEERQPDAGDVLAYVNDDGFFVGPVMLVRTAAQVRGRGPEHLRLVLQEGHVGHLKGSGTVFPAQKRRRRR